MHGVGRDRRELLGTDAHLRQPARQPELGDQVIQYVGRIFTGIVNRLAEWHERGGCGDQEVFLDTWWLLYSLIQVVIFVLSSASVWLVLPAFPLYWTLKRSLLRDRNPPARSAPPSSARSANVSHR